MQVCLMTIFLQLLSLACIKRNLYFPVETNELAEGLTVLEVTPEYLKVECE